MFRLNPEAVCFTPAAPQRAALRIDSSVPARTLSDFARDIRSTYHPATWQDLRIEDGLVSFQDLCDMVPGCSRESVENLVEVLVEKNVMQVVEPDLYWLSWAELEGIARKLARRYHAEMSDEG